jgi:vancomycin permeability regulator SanA
MVHSLVIILDGVFSKLKKADAAVILGTIVEENGELSSFLESRVLAGLELYKTGKVNYLICSGGIGKEGYDEAAIMKAYLIKNNVPDSLIIIDNKGLNTKATAHNLIALSQQYDLKSFVMVSQYFHLSRCKLAMQKEGFRTYTAYSASYVGWRDIFSISREFFAFYKYLLFY